MQTTRAVRPRRSPAVAQVRSLERRIDEISGSLSSLEHRVDRSGRSLNSNCPSISVNLGAHGVALAVYAKTPDRLRFEVRHYRNPRRTYGHHATREAFPSEDWADLPNFLEFVTERAHQRINTFFDALRAGAPEGQPTLALVTSLLSEIASVTNGDANRIRLILSLLLANGRIVVQGNRELLPCLEALEARGFLVRRRNSQRTPAPVYALTTAYVGAIRALALVLPTMSID